MKYAKLTVLSSGEPVYINFENVCAIFDHEIILQDGYKVYVREDIDTVAHYISCLQELEYKKHEVTYSKNDSED